MPNNQTNDFPQIRHIHVLCQHLSRMERSEHILQFSVETFIPPIIRFRFPSAANFPSPFQPPDAHQLVPFAQIPHIHVL
jgi:hypothetical protein